MILARMSRLARVFAFAGLLIAVAAVCTACGTEKISVPKSDATAYAGAQLFNQRCSGCHTLSYAATHGSAANVRTREITNGPNFDVRCERPVTRVLYAIANGGFSGAIMPQNIVVGPDAVAVSQFVATYSGRKAPRVPGTIVCAQQPIGSIPAAVPVAATTTATTATTPAKTKGKAGAKTGAKKKK
jgi:mono/diheme cytochrome c family protein